MMAHSMSMWLQIHMDMDSYYGGFLKWILRVSILSRTILDDLGVPPWIGKLHM
jgi:hypothetical protein